MLNIDALSQFDEASRTDSVNRAPSQPTDLMRRRVALEFSETFVLRSVAVRIETNSGAILRAAAAAGLTPVQEANAQSSCWQLTVEEDAAAPEFADSPRVYRDGQTVFIEIAEREWFAYDTESGDGAGFLAARNAGSVANRYFETLLGILQPEIKNRPQVKGCHD